MDGATDGVSVGFTLGSEEIIADGIQEETIVGVTVGKRVGSKVCIKDGL